MGRACKAAPGSPQYAVEAGYQALLQGDVQGALAQYSRASHLHELDMEAMYGSIECDLLVGKVCGLHLIVFQADRPFLTVFHACVVSCSGCPFSAYMLQSKHSKLGALRKHAWTTKLLTRSLLANTASGHVSPKEVGLLAASAIMSCISSAHSGIRKC